MDTLTVSTQTLNGSPQGGIPLDLLLEIPPPGKGEGRGEGSLIDGGGKRSKCNGRVSGNVALGVTLQSDLEGILNLEVFSC